MFPLQHQQCSQVQQIYFDSSLTVTSWILASTSVPIWEMSFISHLPFSHLLLARHSGLLVLFWSPFRYFQGRWPWSWHPTPLKVRVLQKHTLQNLSSHLCKILTIQHERPKITCCDINLIIFHKEQNIKKQFKCSIYFNFNKALYLTLIKLYISLKMVKIQHT